MIPEDNAAQEVIQKLEEAKSYRSSYWDSQFQECKDVVWPNSVDFTTNRQQGSKLTELIYDSTPVWANGQFANGMHAATCNPTDRWANIVTEDLALMQDEVDLAWLENVSDIIYHVYNNPYANHRQGVHETFQSLGCLGTAVLSQEWSDKRKLPIFKSIPLAKCWIAEGEDGLVNTLYREEDFTINQAIERFGEEALPDKMLEMKRTDKTTFVHAVYPRQERKYDSRLSLGMPFASKWVSVQFKKVVSEGGYISFPYHVTRWEKIPGQVYGRSPAMTCLADIKMLNQMKKVTLEAAQKVVNPPMLVPHDAFMNQFDNTPGGVNEYDSSLSMDSNAIRPFLSGARPDLGEKIMEPIKQSIIACFYADMMSVPFKKERQTAEEIRIRRDDMLRNIGPLIGRQEAELFGPMIQRTFELLSRNKMIPPHPPNLQGAKLRITYVSLAAVAQTGSKLNNLKQFITESLVPLMQLDQGVVDAVSIDDVLDQSAKLGNVTRKVFRTTEDKNAIRKGKADQQQAAAQAAAMESGSAALKNVGQAIQAAPQLGGQ